VNTFYISAIYRFSYFDFGKLKNSSLSARRGFVIHAQDNPLAPFVKGENRRIANPTCLPLAQAGKTSMITRVNLNISPHKRDCEEKVTKGH
jgi:hypothetical protein